MMRYISILATFFVCAVFGAIAPVHAATGTVVKLEIIAPTNARVGEAIDITVRAVDKDKNTVTSYRGSIFFNTDNIGDTLPITNQQVYTFTPDDAGKKTFSKGLIFKKSGKQKVYVSDISADIAGEATITVELANTSSGTVDQGISIITPENNTKITTDSVMVSGKTRKNSKVNIKLNDKIVGSSTSDDTGIFTKNVTGITQENNILVAELIDSSNATISTSSQVKFVKQTQSSSIYGVTIAPASTIEASSPITITVDATAGLSELSVLLDGSLIQTKETSAGKYVLDTIAPNKAGMYKISISQKDALGQSSTSDSPTSLIVTEKSEAPKPVPAFKNIQTLTQSGKVVFDFLVENAPPELSSFKIAYGKNVDSLSNEVVTYTLDKIRSQTTASGYTWYIANIPAGSYGFKIFGRAQDGSLISGLVSEPINLTVGNASCTIGNVGKIQVDTKESKSILSWDPVPGALSYNIYKVSAAGDHVLVENVKDNRYVIHMMSGAVTYDNFAIKALCDTTTESANYSDVSKVQSGPGHIIGIIVIISAILSAVILRRRAL